MKIIIPGGSGQVGQMLVRAFRRRGDECVILTRKQAEILPQSAGVRSIIWDGKTLGPWAAEIDGADVVINLAGRSVNCRYSAHNLSAMMSSRVDSTRIVGAAIAAAKNPPRVWLQASTATIYAHRFDVPNDEASGEIGGNEAGVPALWAKSIDIAKAWEAELAAAQTPHTRKVALRSAMTMSPDRGGVFRMLSRLCRMSVGRQGDGRQFVSWIHEDDFVAAIDFLSARDDLRGAFNLCAPEPLPNRDFMKALRRPLGIKFAVPVPRWALEIGALFLRTETELVLKSRRVVPTRLLKAGFIFRYPRWPEAAKELVGRTIFPRPLTRGWRIAIEILGPAPIGALVWVVGTGVRNLWMTSENGMLVTNALMALPLAILFAYFFVGIQSLFYTAILEWSFARGLDPGSWSTVGLSTVLGLVSGVVIVAASGFSRAGVTESLISSGGVGVSVGLILGLLIKFLSKTRVPA
ncbi:MAG TPA: DUF1731 domain-containing protein [Lacunisphaera sp.]|jgi:hypothetical protein